MKYIVDIKVELIFSDLNINIFNIVIDFLNMKSF